MSPLTLCSFLRYHLHGGPPETADVESLKLQVSELTQKNEELTEEVTQLKQKVFLLCMSLQIKFVYRVLLKCNNYFLKKLSCLKEKAKLIVS